MYMLLLFISKLLLVKVQWWFQGCHVVVAGRPHSIPLLLPGQPLEGILSIQHTPNKFGQLLMQIAFAVRRKTRTKKTI